MVLPHSYCRHRCDTNVQAKWWWKCRIQDWGKYLTRSPCWKRHFNFDWKIFCDTTSLTDLKAGFPSDCACIRHWLWPKNVHLPMHAYAQHSWQRPCLREHPNLFRHGPCAFCWQKWSLMDVIWHPCDVTSLHWLKVSYSGGANRVSLVTYTSGWGHRVWNWILFGKSLHVIVGL